jgi:hypothetical protein
MKVLFLDHDGVICLQSEWGGRFEREREGLDSVFDDFNSKALTVLNEVIEETDCEIVVSSDWKYHASLSEMQELYRIRGIKKSPIDMTGKADYSTAQQLERARCIEIRQYLEKHPEITTWVAIDDMDLSSLVNFVWTPNSTLGISQPGVKEKLIDFLNIK